MKKIICLITVLISIFSIIVSADVIHLSEEAKRDLYNFGIMIGDQNGDLKLKDNITRAEFCKMICVALGFKNIQPSVVEDFYDVDTEHWAYHYIQTARGLALVEGIGNSCFAPDKNISIQDSVKIIVTALGYKPEAEKEGYPEGYINKAEQIGLTDSDKFIFQNYATREEVALLISKSLDIPLMQQTSFGKEAVYTVMNGEDGIPLVTLRRNLTASDKESSRPEEDNTIPRFNGNEYTGRIIKISGLENINGNYIFKNALDTKDNAVYKITENTYVYLSNNTLDLSHIKNGIYLQCWYYANSENNIELLKIELMKEKPAGVAIGDSNKNKPS